MLQKFEIYEILKKRQHEKLEEQYQLKKNFINFNAACITQAKEWHIYSQFMSMFNLLNC